MTPEQLSAYIGEIDDELIAGARQNHQRHKENRRGKWIMAAAGLAACAVIGAVGTAVWVNRQAPLWTEAPDENGYTETGEASFGGFVTGGGESEAPDESFIGTAGGSAATEIYYIRNGKVESSAAAHEEEAKEVFALWKKMNGIGDEIQFVSAELRERRDGRNGYVTVYRLTVTNSPLSGSEGEDGLLYESLKRTMLFGENKKAKEFELIVQEGQK